MSLNAASYDYEIILTNIDHVRILDHIFDAITFFFDRDSGNVGSKYYSLLSIVVLLGVLFSTVRMAVSAMTGNAAMGIKQYVIYLLSIVFVLTIIYGPRSNVLIQTKDSSWYATHEKIPQLFAFTISFFTKLRSELSELSEEAFSIPTPTDNFKSGGSGGLGFVGMETELVGAVMSANFTKPGVDENLQPMYSRYLRDCVILPAVALGKNNQITKIQSSSALMTDISPAATGYTNEFISWNGSVDRCSRFWDGTIDPALVDVNGTGFPVGFIPLLTKLTAFNDAINYKGGPGAAIPTTATTGGENYADLASALAYSGALMNQATAISNAASVKAAATQAVMSNEFKSTFSAMGVAGQVMADGAAQSAADSQISGIATGLYMSKMLPMFSFLVYALMIAAVPFMFAFALLPGSLSVMMNFLKTLMWVALWDPMANILGLFMDFYFAQNLKDKGFDTASDVLGMSASSIVNVSSEAAMIAGIAGGMYVAVQGLSWMLVTGSGQMLGNLMGGLASSFQNRANAEAQMATRADMAEGALMSKELGHAVSMREKYAFNAMTGAANNAGALAGDMHAYGGGVAGIAQKSHVGAVSSAHASGQSIGMTNELGTGVSAANKGEILGAAAGGSINGATKEYGNVSNASETARKASALATGTQVKTMAGLNDTNIGESSSLAASTAIGQMKQSVQATKDKQQKLDPQKSWQEFNEESAGKQTYLQTGTNLETMGQVSPDDIKTSTVVEGSKAGSTIKGSVVGAREQYGNNNEEIRKGVATATQASVKSKTISQFQDGDNLAKLDNEIQSDGKSLLVNMAKHEGNMQSQLKANTIKAAGKKLHTNNSATMHSMEANAATSGGAQIASLDKSIQHVGGASAWMDDQITAGVASAGALHEGIKGVESGQYIKDAETVSRGNTKGTRQTILNAGDGKGDSDGSKGYVKSMEGKGRDSGSSLHNNEAFNGMSPGQMQDMANKESMVNGPKHRIGVANQMGADMKKEQLREEIGKIGNDTSLSATQREQKIEQAVEKFNSGVDSNSKINIDQIKENANANHATRTSEMSAAKSLNTAKIQDAQQQISSLQSKGGLYDVAHGSGAAHNKIASLRSSISKLDGDNKVIDAQMKKESARTVSEIGGAFSASAIGAFAGTGGSEQAIVAALAENRMLSTAKSAGAGDQALSEGAGVSNYSAAQTGAGGTASTNASVATQDASGGFVANQVATTQNQAQKIVASNQNRSHVMSALQGRIKALAGNDQAAMKFFADRGVFSNNPAIAMAGIESLRELGVNTMVNGASVNTSVNEHGEIAHQTLKAEDGVNFKAHQNYDMTNNSISHFTEGLSVGAQTKIAAGVTAAKAIGSEALAMTPQGKAYRALKHVSTNTAKSKAENSSND